MLALIPRESGPNLPAYADLRHYSFCMDISVLKQHLSEGNLVINVAEWAHTDPMWLITVKEHGVCHFLQLIGIDHDRSIQMRITGDHLIEGRNAPQFPHIPSVQDFEMAFTKTHHRLSLPRPSSPEGTRKSQRTSAPPIPLTYPDRHIRDRGVARNAHGETPTRKRVKVDSQKEEKVSQSSILK